MIKQINVYFILAGPYILFVGLQISKIFHWHNPSGHTLTLQLTQPLTEISTRNISWGDKGGQCVGLQPYHLHVPIVLKSGSLKLLEPSGPVQDCNGIVLPFY